MDRPRLGPYEMGDRIGAGGMGEVYLAHDPRLKRDVAVKVLPAELSRDPERLARLEREAQLLASLDHPNVAAVYGLEEDEGVRFLVMQLARGETLADRLAAGPLQVDEALPIARQIAEGLAAAHDRGVVHRDLKPGNVMVAADGAVKILDFGLAKAVTLDGGSGSGSLGDQTASPTILAPTQAGMILGTAAYMSPEQARGRPVDRRSDLWGLGCVIYEMLTGERAFGGETASDALAAILRQEPDVSRLPADLPDKVVDLIRRCLQKDPAHRQRDAGDVALELGEALRGGYERPVAAAAQRVRGAAAWVPWVTAATAIAIAAWALVRDKGPDVQAPAISEIERLVQEVGIIAEPAFAPDGGTVTYTSNRDGDFDIYVRRIDGSEDVLLTDSPADDIQPSVSPDGARIAFVSTRASERGLARVSDNLSFDYRTFGGDIWTMSSLGGQASRLAEAGNYPSWHPDGQSVVYVAGEEFRREVRRVDVADREVEVLVTGDASNAELVRVLYSPDGRWLTLETNDDRLFLVEAGGGTPVEILRASSHTWSPAGASIYYLRHSRLGTVAVRQVGFDTESGELLEGSDRLLGLLPGVFGEVSASAQGDMLVLAEQLASMNLTRVPIDPMRGVVTGAEEVLTPGQVIDHTPSLSRDGRRVAFESTRGDTENIHVLDVETRETWSLDLPGSMTSRTPDWHPEGNLLLVQRSAEDGANELWIVGADGSEARKVLDLDPSTTLDGGRFSPDGDRLVLVDLLDGMAQVFTADWRTGERTQITFSPATKFNVRWSPDGAWLTYASNSSGTFHVWRVPAAGGQEQQLTFGASRILHPSFPEDGRWLYVQPDHTNIFRVPAGGGELQQVTRFAESGLYIDEPEVSPDGRYLYYTRSNMSSGLWLIRLEAASPR